MRTRPNIAGRSITEARPRPRSHALGRTLGPILLPLRTRALARPPRRPARPRRVALSATLKATSASKSVIERHFPRHPRLIRTHATLEEVRHFLHVLERHEGKRILRVVQLFETKRRQALIGAVLEVALHVGHRQARDASAEQVFGELHFASDGFVEHSVDLGAERRVNQVWLFFTHGAHDLESEGHVSALVAE